MNIVKILIFNLNSFRDVLSFSSLGIELHILEPTAAAVSVPYITVRMFRGLDLKKKTIWAFFTGKNFIHGFRSKLQAPYFDE